MLKESVGLIKTAVHILLQGVPENIDLDEVESMMTSTSGVASVHDLDVWAVAPENIVVSTHLVLEDWLSPSEAADTLRQVKRGLHEHFGVERATLEVDHDSQCAGLTCAD